MDRYISRLKERHIKVTPQRIAIVEVMERAPEGLNEDEWVSAIVQEGEFIPVPEPEMALKVYQRVMAGEDYNTVMNEMLASLPEDWRPV